MSKRMWTSLLVVAVILVIGLLFSVVKSRNPETAQVGAVLPLTGYAAEFGKYMQHGLELAAEDINSTGGIRGRKVALVVEDSQGDPKTGLSAAKKIFATTNAKVLFTSISGVTLALLPDANRNDVLVITSSTHPQVTTEGNLALRNYLTSAQEGEAIANYTISTLGLKKVAIVHLDDEAYGAYADAIRKVFAKAKGEVVAHERYQRGTSDFRGILVRVKAVDPAVLFLGGWSEMGIICKQARELGIGCQIVGPSTFESSKVVQVAGDAVEGVYFTAPLLDKRNPKYRKFLSAYRRKYGQDPEVTAAEFYDSLCFLATAMREAPNAGGSALREAMLRMTYDGVMGRISYLPNGDIQYPIVIKKINEGTFVTVSQR